MNLPTLESMHIPERLENMYAQIIAEEDKDDAEDKESAALALNGKGDN